GRAWDWNETGTHHVPGIQLADVEELRGHGARTVILSRGMHVVLQTCPETLDHLRKLGIRVHVLETKEAAKVYNQLATQGEAVGGLFHSTCSAAAEVGVPIRGRLWSALPPVLLVLSGAWWVFGSMAGRIGSRIPSVDIYASSYPNVVYGLRSLREGHGFLWNRFQNCGQPFPAARAVSAFSPLNLVFVGLDVDHGIMAIAFPPLAVAGLGPSLLCREIGLARPAALCGAITFQLGNH